MDVSMSHLITEQVCGRVHFCHECSVGVAEDMILEIDTQFALYLTGGVFEGIDRLNCAVRQAIHQFCGGNLTAVQVFDEALLLFPQFRKSLCVLRPLPKFFCQVFFQQRTQIDCPAECQCPSWKLRCNNAG